jgi:CRP-like cAMP-binding protein
VALGEQATIAVRGPGESFGEMALVGRPARRSATVEALEDGETFCVRDTEFDRLRRDHPEVSELIIGFLANEVRMLNERLLEALYLPVEQRVLRRLNELASLYAHADDDQVEVPLTQEELAGLAGSTRATVNTVLRDAQRRGLVELARGKTGSSTAKHSHATPNSDAAHRLGCSSTAASCGGKRLRMACRTSRDFPSPERSGDGPLSDRALS